jgi:hypothetical protein
VISCGVFESHCVRARVDTIKQMRCFDIVGGESCMFWCRKHTFGLAC